MAKTYEDLPPKQYENELLLRKTQLEHLIASKKKQINQAPTGHLRLSRSNGKIQYYYVQSASDKNGKYLGKNELSLAREIAQSDYDKKLISKLQEELTTIENLLSQLKQPDLIYNELHPGRQTLVTPATLSPNEYAKIWSSIEYKRKEFSSDAPILITSKGERVRSKSEVIIADTLYRLGIPYRYEFPLNLQSFNVHPDFYCLNLRTRKEFVWEHFGMLEDSEYAQNSVEKLYHYQKSGYFPGKNLIISTESRVLPLSSKQVEQIAKEYLI